jgi:hypothetical protein
MDAAFALPRRMDAHRSRWRDALEKCVEQEPLLLTGPSRAALAEANPPSAPGAIMFGVGLCTPDALSATVPFDLLGLVLPAELLRRAVGASTVVALVADVHAETSGFDAAAVDRRARAVTAALLRMRRRLGLDALTVVRASRLHAALDYRQHLRTARARAGAEPADYLVHQVADVACLDARLGGLLKLGWMVGKDRAQAIGDEAAFDRWVRPWTRREPLFAYARAGRTLDPLRPKATPYVELEAAARVNLAATEDVARKLASASDLGAVNGVKNHLRAIAHTYARVVGPLRGPVVPRAQRILDRLYRPSLEDEASKCGRPMSSSIPGIVATKVSAKYVG